MLVLTAITTPTSSPTYKEIVIRIKKADQFSIRCTKTRTICACLKTENQNQFI